MGLSCAGVVSALFEVSSEEFFVSLDEEFDDALELLDELLDEPFNGCRFAPHTSHVTSASSVYLCPAGEYTWSL